MKNIGMIDKVIRLILGIVGISLVFFGPQTVWGWIGVVPLLTGAINFCPLYKLLGLSSAPKESESEA